MPGIASDGARQTALGMSIAGWLPCSESPAGVAQPAEQPSGKQSCEPSVSWEHTRSVSGGQLGGLLTEYGATRLGMLNACNGTRSVPATRSPGWREPDPAGPARVSALRSETGDQRGCEQRQVKFSAASN